MFRMKLKVFTIFFLCCVYVFLFSGPVVGNFAMDLAMHKAKDTGVGWVTARGTFR